MIEKDNKHISVSRQCDLLDIHRSGLYYHPCPESEDNLTIMRLLDEQYFKTPFYGVRKVTVWLQWQGYQINRKRTRRLMELMGWQTIYRAPRTSVGDKQHKIYPYLLKGLEINRKGQVWATDITYIPMAKGFMYLCAVIDLYTRFVVSWGISNTMSADWCREVMAEAIERYGKPEIVNTDQGTQFTSEEFTGLLLAEGVQISMDGKGRAIDNIFVERLWRSVKYEHVYLYAPVDGVQLYKGLKWYFDFYNTERFHQSLDYKLPGVVHKKAVA